MLATEYAEWYGLPAQAETEDDYAFRSRVAGQLRDMGHIIEAHEAQNNARYEDSEDTMTGIFGAVAQAMSGVKYGSRGERQVGDDIAAGYVTRHKKKEPDLAVMLMAIMMSERR